METDQRLRACVGAEAIPKRHASGWELGRVLPPESAFDQAAQHVSDDEGLRRATVRPARMAGTTGAGTSARTSRLAAPCKNVQSASSSSSMHEGSL